MPVWTIEINGVSQNWKHLNFNRKLILNTPTNFSATIEYDSTIHFMDVVEIKRDGVTEWKGYIEKLQAYWDDTGQYYNISGRDATMILWKKYSDDFTNFAQKTAGMFGTVDPMQMLHFILHTPKSEIGIDYPYNKEGWGLDFCRTIDSERTTAHYGDSSFSIYAVGNPSWVFSRERGYGWSGTGRETYTSISNTLNGIDYSDWTKVGSSPSPYIDGNTLPTVTNPPSDYFHYTKTSPFSTITKSYLTCEMPTWTLTNKTVKAVTVVVGYAFKNQIGPLKGPFGIEVYYYSHTKGENILIGTITDPDNIISPIALWNNITIDFTKLLVSPDDLESADFKILFSQYGDWETWGTTPIGLGIGIYIGYVNVSVMDGESINAVQTANDDFEIVFKPELLTPAGSKFDVVNTPLAIDRNGIVGEYLLNEGTGTTIYDSSGTNADAQAYNIDWEVGPTGAYLLEMLGSGSYIDCGNSFTWLTGKNSMSLDCWCSFTKLLADFTPPIPYRNTIACKADQFWIYIAGTVEDVVIPIYAGSLVWKLYTSTGWHTVVAPVGTVVQNGRNHLQFIYDGVSMNIYNNGELIATDEENGTISIDSSVVDGKLYFGQMYGYLADVFIYDRAIYPTITAIYMECRANPEYFPRNYTVEYLDANGAWSVIPNTYPSMPQVYDANTNPYPPDILISFPEISTQKVRIRLTDNSTEAPWGISQIYVYKVETLKYRPYLDTGESDPSIPTPDPYEYLGGPYIKAFSDDLDGAVGNPIGPLNMSRQRMLDAVNYIVGLASTTSVGESDVIGFLPFEWWLAYDDDNTFHIKTQKGSDLSSTITFQDGVNLGSCDYQQFIDDTVQNIYVVGQGEQKKLQDTSLWVKSEKATGNATNGQPLADAEKTVRTFFEDAVQNKTIIMDDNLFPAVGNIVGSSNLTINAMPRVQLTITLSKDTYTSMQYDVGDVVQIIDSLTGIGTTDPSLGKYRIQNIEINVQVDTGEDIRITLGYPNYKFEDELQTMYRNMKSFGIVGTFNDDWSAEGTDKKLLDARLISTTSQYSQDAQNDKISQTIPYNNTLWITKHIKYTNPPTEVAGTDNHFMWGSNEWFGMTATTGDTYTGTQLNSHLLSAILKGNVVSYYDPNTSAEVDGCDVANISMTWNPHMVMDIKLLDGAYSDIAGASWSYNKWNRGDGTFTGDYCRVGMADDTGTYGFWFMFVKQSDDSTIPALFDVYVQWSLPDGTTNFDINGYNYLNNNISGFESPNGSYLKTIIANQRYKIEMITQSDPSFIATNTPNVKFNLYEYRNTFSTTNEGLQLNYTQLAYPTLGIVVNNEIYKMAVKPLHCQFFNLAQATPSTNSASAVSFYNWTTEWVVKQISAESA